MAFLNIKHVNICGISAAVPAIKENVRDIKILTAEDANKLLDSTGIESRRISSSYICTSDLCIAAAETLIRELEWNKNEIECLIFVTQTPDYTLPATSLILQDKLGLNSNCLAFDISLGCSGWVYGLSVISSLISSSGLKKGLFLAGDTVTKFCSKKDKSTYPLFGDAGTATAVEFNNNNSNLYFALFSDGEGKESIIIPDGGFRNPVCSNSFEQIEESKQIVRNKMNLILDGMNVFSFGISKAPESVNQLIQQFEINKDDVNDFIFHQANLFMNEKIRKKLKLGAEKVPYSLKDFGNTSSATIPLTLVTQRQNELINFHRKNIACGFGVGLSWGSVYFETNKIVCPNLIEI